MPSVYQFFAQEQNRHTIERLRAANVRLDQRLPTGASPVSRQALTGKVFVLTGTLPHLTRDQARDIISAAGGRVTSSVSRKTDYVLAGAEPGSKYEQALRLGVPILSEAQLYELLGEPHPPSTAQNKAANSVAHLVPERVAPYNQAYPAFLCRRLEMSVPVRMVEFSDSL